MKSKPAYQINWECQGSSTSPLVFLNYGREDIFRIRRLRKKILASGFRPWMDEIDIRIGQEWVRETRAAIVRSDFFVSCFSSRISWGRGEMHQEMEFALNVARELPEGRVFFLPVCLDPCRVPRKVAERFHYVNLFERGGFKRLESTIRNYWTKER
jgi:hypothetical protein